MTANTFSLHFFMSNLLKILGLAFFHWGRTRPFGKFFVAISQARGHSRYAPRFSIWRAVVNEPAFTWRVRLSWRTSGLPPLRVCVEQSFSPPFRVLLLTRLLERSQQQRKERMAEKHWVFQRLSRNAFCNMRMYSWAIFVYRCAAVNRLVSLICKSLQINVQRLVNLGSGREPCVFSRVLKWIEKHVIWLERRNKVWELGWYKDRDLSVCTAGQRLLISTRFQYESICWPYLRGYFFVNKPCADSNLTRGSEMKTGKQNKE